MDARGKSEQLLAWNMYSKLLIIFILIIYIFVVDLK